LPDRMRQDEQLDEDTRSALKNWITRVSVWSFGA
jgi:hypothetical protein